MIYSNGIKEEYALSNPSLNVVGTGPYYVSLVYLKKDHSSIDERLRVVGRRAVHLISSVSVPPRRVRMGCFLPGRVFV